MTILITGPIANGHYGYFEKLIEGFKLLQKELDTVYSERIYLAFLFSELDKEKFKKRFNNPVDIVDLYNIASLILLPSETEGRGLPIIEASASGKPIFCSRYFPEHVYSHVIGEHLPEKDRLKVIEYDGKKIRNKLINRIIDEVFFPHTASDIFTHNQNVVKKRYSLESLNKNIQQICGRLYYQLKPTSTIHKLSIEALEEYSKIVNHKSKDLDELINTEKRHYLPGFGRLSFMLYLESLIDPSAFRVEEQEIKGMTYSFAQEILENDPNFEKIHFNKLQDFFNALNFLFEYNKGSIKLQHDHSFAYRHRNKKYYPYQDFTYQELTGLVNMLYLRIIQPKSIYPVDSGIHFFTDWNLALTQMTSSSELVIDDRDVLIEKLKANIPIAVFSGKYVRHELEFFVLQAFRARYGLKLEQELTEEILTKGLEGKKKIYLFVRRQPVRGASPADQVLEFIKSGKDQELKLLLKYKLLVIVKTNQWCVGIHFSQTGPTALKYLKKIKNENGLIISHHRNAAVMTDIVDIDRIHIDRVSDPLTANILGVPEGAGYIQFVPASVRTTLAYPTPVQTAFDFHKILKSKRFINLCKTRGKDEIFKIIREDAIHKGTPLNELIDQIVLDKKRQTNEVESNNVTGVYKDQMPWNGAIARTNTPRADQKWKYIAVNSKDKTKTVEEFIKEFESKTRKKVNIAWNGGYILNPELVGKLGLSESYIGSPLGLLISEHKTLCPPLFNKPALLVFADGTIDIQRVSVKDGFEIFSNNKSLNFSKEYYNVAAQSNGYNFYDLLNTEQEIGGGGHVVVRLAGNTVKEILYTQKDPVSIIPVGITLSFSPKNFPEGFFEEGKEVEIKLKNFENIEYAVEAGPMLLDNGELCIDMKAEGWKHENSIRTQAARLDYLDMRGPKIAVGINNEGNLAVLTINGRIRESVGATHTDMGDILKNFGFKKAMGFDPGGSSTLVVDGKVLNISPYNQDYQRNKYSLPPEPRAVSNAVLGILEKK